MAKKKAKKKTAGYSGTPLAKKLGIKAGFRACFLRAPADFADMVAPLPPDASVLRSARPPMDLVLFFSKRQYDLGKHVPWLASTLAPAGMLWIAWPKKASGVSTDLSFDVVQTVGLSAGLVDVKICAVDETWSALKFVIPVKKRPRGRSR